VKASENKTIQSGPEKLVELRAGNRGPNRVRRRIQDQYGGDGRSMLL